MELEVSGRGVVSTDINGSYRLDRFGTYTCHLRVRTTQRSAMRIDVDNVNVFAGNNWTQRTITTGHEPCAEYSIPNLRTACKSGYRQEDRSRYRWKQRNRRYRNGVGGDYFYTYGEWSDNPNISLPASSGSMSGTGVFRWAATLESELNYVCVPESNCQGTPITEIEYGNTGNYEHRFSVDIARTQAEQDALDRLEELQNQQPPETPSPTEEAIQELAEAIEENTRAAEEALKNKDDFTPTLAPVETTEDTKYRLITPLEYERTRDGKIVPRIRYESVRFLSPANVASFVARGYTVEAVNPNTPTSNSKPHGKTLVERAHILTPPSVQTRDVFDRQRKSGQQIIAERLGREFNPTPLNSKKRRIVR